MSRSASAYTDANNDISMFQRTKHCIGTTKAIKSRTVCRTRQITAYCIGYKRSEPYAVYIHCVVHRRSNPLGHKGSASE